MDYLRQFSKDFWQEQIPIREAYSSLQTKSFSQIEKDKPKDVIDDLLNSPLSLACLDLAKHIVSLSNEQKITLNIPRIGDLFIGLIDQSIIKSVTYTFHNHKEAISVEAHREPYRGHQIWVISRLPIPLLCLTDYKTNHLEVNIYLNASYNLQTSNQDVFKAFFGYFNKSIQFQLVAPMIYEIPLNVMQTNSETRSSVSETRSSVLETRSSVLETRSSVSETGGPVRELENSPKLKIIAGMWTII